MNGQARVSNTQLAALMHEAQLSQKSLAAHMRMASERDGGKPIAPSHTNVSKWLSGETRRPNARTCQVLVKVLSARLQRRLALEDVGYGSAAGDAPDVAENGAAYPTDVAQAVNVLEDLTSADLNDSPAVTRSRWVPAAAPGVITGYLFEGDSLDESEAGTFARDAGTGAAARIRSTIRNLTELDFQFGGGHTRSMLLAYWKAEVVPALHRSQPGPVRREIFRAAADAAEVLGWSAYDAGRHGWAQRYFVQGLRLAREADDPLMGGQILSNLSHQANYLGNFDEAAKYAKAALSAVGRSASPRVVAMFYAMLARALASIADVKGCMSALSKSEQAFEKCTPGTDPDWIAYFDELELAGEAAHCFRDLGRAEETRRFAAQAVNLTRTPPRTRAFIGMVDAAGALKAGNLDEALALATDAVTLAGALQSSRYLRYVSDFHKSVAERHVGNVSVIEFSNLVGDRYPGLLQSRAA